MKHKFLSFIGICVIIGIIGAMGIAGNKGTVNPSKSIRRTASGEPILNVGDAFRTDKFESVISKIEERTKVGSQNFQKKPSEGRKYIAVQWQYRNITDNPIDSLSHPSIKLLDSKNTKYDADVGASDSYTKELELNTKISSELNPGITVTEAQVFEISKELYDKGGFKVLIDTDKKAYVDIN